MELYLITNTSYKNLTNEMKDCGVSQAGIKLMIDKSQHFVFKIRDIDNRGINILKQEALSLGAETAVSHKVGNFNKGKSSGLLFATKAQVKKLIPILKTQPFQLNELAQHLEQLFQTKEMMYTIRDKTFDFSKKQYVMGILNITPDSFYDGGVYQNLSSIERQIRKMIKEKVEIIDIGAESTRPGAKKISAKEEIKRLKPVLKLARTLTNIPISIDTYKSEVAHFALTNGADIINDISGLQFDKKMAKTIAKYSASAILMHIKGTPKTMQKSPHYANLIIEIMAYLKKSIRIAQEHNISQIIIDPGIGFGKTVLHNYEIIDRLHEFSILHYPILVGLSRKSLIGSILNQSPTERLYGTIALNLMALLNGASIIRVHDIKEAHHTIRLAKAFLKTRGQL